MTQTYCRTLTALFLASTMCFESVRAQDAVVLHLSDGHLASYATGEVDSITFSTEGSVEHDKWYHTLENPGIADYLRDFEYDAADYSYTRIFSYRGLPYLDAQQSWPYGVTLRWQQHAWNVKSQIVEVSSTGWDGHQGTDSHPEHFAYNVSPQANSATLYNLTPGRTYYYRCVVDGLPQPARRFHTLGQLRMLRLDNLRNVRDLGGWPLASGRHVAYGRIYRGEEMNTVHTDRYQLLHSITPADSLMMRDLLGIGADLDLRSAEEIPYPGSPLGQDLSYINLDINDLPKIMNYLLEQLTQGRAVYVHCVWGADRTGQLATLIGGLLGMSQSDLDKDFELTSFAANTRYRFDEKHLALMNAVRALPGATLQEQFRAYWTEKGATAEQLDTFVSLMTEQ